MFRSWVVLYPVVFGREVCSDHRVSKRSILKGNLSWFVAIPWHVTCNALRDTTSLWDVSIYLRGEGGTMPGNRETLGSHEVCRILQISSRQLEYWVLIGIVHPVLEPHGRRIFRRFTHEDLEFLKHVKELTDEGFPISKAAEKIRAKAAEMEGSRQHAYRQEE